MQENYLIEIKNIILSKEISKKDKIKLLENYHSSDIADVLEELSEEERLEAYKIFDISDIAEIFTFYEDVDKFVDELPPEKAADILEEMDSDEAMDILDELEEDDKQEIINLMEDEQKQKIEELDKYEEDQIGSYMSDNYITIQSNFTIKEAMSALVKEAGEHDNIYTIFVVEDGKFYGSIDLKDLICARKEDKLLDFCRTSYPSIYDDESMEDAIVSLTDYSENSIPVINRSNELVGVITSDILLGATTEEFEEDYAKLGGLTDSEDIDESIFTSIKKRIPWLVILLVLGFLVSTVVGAFEGVIATLPVVVFFQSTILDMAGNVGTQSLAVTIRNITTGDMEGKNVRKGIFKEVRVGFLNGLIIGVVSFVFIFLFLLLRKQEIVSGDGFVIYDIIKVSSIIATSMLVAMTISSLTGSLFPIILNKIHIDPAVASGPFITTLNDVLAVFLYYGLAYLAFILFL